MTGCTITHCGSKYFSTLSKLHPRRERLVQTVHPLTRAHSSGAACSHFLLTENNTPPVSRTCNRFFSDDPLTRRDCCCETVPSLVISSGFSGSSNYRNPPGLGQFSQHVDSYVCPAPIFKDCKKDRTINPMVHRAIPRFIALTTTGAIIGAH